MSHIGRVKIYGWKRFRTESNVEIGPGVHSLVARWDGEPDRSNFAGKSAFFGAIAYALVGYLDRGEVLDDLITRGEDECGIRVEIAGDPAHEPTGWVERTIRRGRGSTVEAALDPRFTVTVPWAVNSERGTAKGEQAQRLLDDYLVGFGKDDFVAGPFGRQKHLDHLVQATPSELMAKFGAWLDLGKLVEGQGVCRGRANEARKRRDKVAAQLEMAEKRLAEFPPQLELGADAAAAVMELTAAQVRFKAVDVEYEKIAKLEQQAIEYDKLEKELDVLEHRGKAKRAELDELEKGAPSFEEIAAAAERAEVTTREAGAARVHLIQAQSGARGNFDGKCPVAGIDCPAKDEINRGGKQARARAEKAKAEADAALDKSKIANATVEVMRANRAMVTECGAELQAIRERFNDLADKFDQFEVAPTRVGADELRTKRQDAQSALWQAEQAKRDVDAKVTRRRAATAEVERLRAERAEAAHAMVVAARGAGVFAAAQRAVAEASLAEVEALANVGLVGAGLPLSVMLRWWAEKKGLADECAACGQAFPRSKKIKECAACGEPRGEKVEEWPAIIPSDRSGAADDVCGTLVQAAAAAWLRGERGSSFASILLDEPTSATDASNTRALERVLRTLLCSPAFGYEQAIVSSHDAATQEAFERRIVVVAERNGSRLEVE